MNGEATFGAGETYVLRPLLLILLVALVVPAAAVGETDLPNEWSEALTVPLGSYEGDVGPHDSADWLRFELGEGWSLRADISGEASGFPRFEMYADDGHSVASWGLVDNPTYFSGGKDAVRFGIIAPPQGAFTYRVTFTATLLPDVRMDNLTVTSLGIPMATGHTFTGATQVIEFDLVNDGPVGGLAHTFVWVWPATNPSPRPPLRSHSDAQDVYVPAGETVHVTYEWTSWRVVGDFTVYASADMNGAEVDPRDNSLVTRGSSILAGTGMGVDATRAPCVVLPLACHFVPL